MPTQGQIYLAECIRDNPHGVMVVLAKDEQRDVAGYLNRGTVKELKHMLLEKRVKDILNPFLKKQNVGNLLAYFSFSLI